ncbi:MAG: copper chaperone PCu(A)C [Pseudomonadota bacterium]
MKIRISALLGASVMASLAAFPAMADGITVEDAYARSSNPRAGAAFMIIRNTGAADRLIAARADIARRVELHTHLEENGVMKMREVIAIDLPTDSEVELKRGGLHVMFMGLSDPMEDGERFPLTLVFQSGDEVTIDVPVDLSR